MHRVRVRLQQRSYPVVTGFEALDKLKELVAKHCTGGKLFIVYDSVIFALYSKLIQAALKGSKIKIQEMVVAGHERSKTQSMLGKLHDWLLQERIARDDLVLACGGGVISDLSGLAAATALRGVRWGIVSTTLLGMVDAAVGGKTGINHRLGKNLIGAIWQPSFVVCDLDMLNTLPPRQMMAGFGEVVKYTGLCGGNMMAASQKCLDNDLSLNPQLARLIATSARYKADIVSMDERESGKRTLLNFGHTFGHGLEASLGYGKLLHGEAVAIGIIGALELSCLLKPGRRKKMVVYEKLVQQLVRRIPRRKVDRAGVIAAMKLDKKRIRGNNRFVLLNHPGAPIIADGVPARLVNRAIDRMLKMYDQWGGTDAANTRR